MPLDVYCTFIFSQRTRIRLQPLALHSPFALIELERPGTVVHPPRTMRCHMRGLPKSVGPFGTVFVGNISCEHCFQKLLYVLTLHPMT